MGRTNRVWCVLCCDALSVEEESASLHVFTLAVAEGLHQFAKFSLLLDFEEDFIVVVSNFDVQVFWLLWFGTAVVTHFAE